MKNDSNIERVRDGQWKNKGRKKERKNQNKINKIEKKIRSKVYELNIYGN